jgi:hypothetical protein
MASVSQVIGRWFAHQVYALIGLWRKWLKRRKSCQQSLFSRTALVPVFNYAQFYFKIKILNNYSKFESLGLFANLIFGLKNIF